MSKPRPRVKPTHFFEQHPVFAYEEFVASEPRRPIETVKALLRYHVKEGNLARVRRGLYIRADWFDPWLLASRLAPDAVLAYDGAWQLQRPAPPSVTDLARISFLTASPRALHEDLGGIDFRAVRPPRALGKRWAAFEVVTLERGTLSLRITSPERTFVDLLDRLDLAPPAGELWESFVHARLDPAPMVRHARALGNRLLAARLGFFLEHLPRVPRAHLEALERLRPSSPAYFDRAGHSGQSAFLSRWNLVVTQRLLQTLVRTDFRGRSPVLPRDSELPA